MIKRCSTCGAPILVGKECWNCAKKHPLESLQGWIQWFKSKNEVSLRGSPFDKIYLKKDEIKEIKEKQLKVPVMLGGRAIHTYYAKFAFLALLFTVVAVLLIVVIGMTQGISNKTIGILAAIFGVPGIIFAIYFMIKETILRMSIRRRGDIEDDKFWIFVGDRRNLID